MLAFEHAVTRSSQPRHWTRMKTLTTISSSVLFGVLTLGCGEDGILLAEILEGIRDQDPPVDAPGDPVDPRDPPSDPPPATDVGRAAVERILLNRCGGCHGPSVNAGGLDNIQDIDALIERGLIVPGDPDGSLLFVRIETGSMPPEFVDDEVTDEELATLRTFILELGALDKAGLSETLDRFCSDCHTDDPDTAAGQLINIGDIDALIEIGQIVPGNRNQSNIYLRMESGTMPPPSVDTRPSPQLIEAVGAGIDAL
jgi:mono/diheme cytochrome c family protein